MKLNWYESEGTQDIAPDPVNLNWSEILVYLHRNVRRVTKTNSITGEIYEVWQYDEAQLTRSDYAIYLAEQAMGGVEESQIATCELSEELDERITEIETALCDLSELIA